MNIPSRIFFTLFILCSTFFFAQNQYEITTSTDSTQVKIGSEVIYRIQIKTQDENPKLLFNKKSAFFPFDTINSYPIDTTKIEDFFLFTKKYSLIPFEDGLQYIPSQPLIINGKLFNTDSIPIKVETVKVDTVQKKIYDIKPIIAVKKNNRDIFIKIGIGIGIIIGILLLILVLKYIFKNRKLSLKKKLPPLEQAIEDLKKLESVSLNEQEELKDYYSRLTNIIRKYLEDEVNIPAMESTSKELLVKLKTLNETKKIQLDKEVFKEIEKVFENADLAKFAKALIDSNNAKKDKVIIEKAVVQTHESIPEPDFESLKKQEEHLKKEQLKEKVQRLKMVSIVFASVIAIGLITCFLIFGYYPVKDTLFRYPTKVLKDTKWYTSKYGAPAVQITAPRILIRDKNAAANEQLFSWGDIKDRFYTHLKITTLQEKNEEEIDVETYANEIISEYENLGAVNILIKNELTTINDIKGVKIFGTLDLPKNNEKEKIRCNYITFFSAFESHNINITIIYATEDRYGKDIENRILQSLKLFNIK